MAAKRKRKAPRPQRRRAPQTAVTKVAKLLGAGVSEPSVLDACSKELGLTDRETQDALARARRILARQADDLAVHPQAQALVRLAELNERAILKGDLTTATTAQREINRILGVGEPPHAAYLEDGQGAKKLETERWKIPGLPRWTRVFLAALTLDPSATAAAKLAGHSRSAAYQLRSRHPDFAEAWDKAVEEAVEALESECHRRALHGSRKGVYYHGKLVGWDREYSDALAMFLLKAHRPEKYREVVDVGLRGSLELLSADLSKRSPEELQRLAHAIGAGGEQGPQVAGTAGPQGAAR